METKTQKIFKALKLLLYCCMVSVIFRMCFSSIAIFSASVNLKKFNGIIGWPLSGIGIAETVVFILWIYYLFDELQKKTNFRPFTPGSAVVMLVVPVYHWWGLWRVFSVLAQFLKIENGGAALKQLVQMIIIIDVTTMILAINFTAVLEMDIRSNIYLTVGFSIASLVMYILKLSIIGIVHNSMNQTSGEQEESDIP